MLLKSVKRLLQVQYDIALKFIFALVVLITIYYFTMISRNLFNWKLSRTI